MANPIRVSHRNIFLKSARRRKAKGERRNFNRFFLVLFFPLAFCLLPSAFLSGCGAKYTYPADKVPKAIQDICLKENQINTQVRVAGKTVGALVVMRPAPDGKEFAPKEINDIMGKVMQVMTRVALSSDLDLHYCTIILRDPAKMSEYVITRSVDDTKRAEVDMIGIEESMNRTLFGQSRYLPNVKNKNSFQLKDIQKEDFLTEQMVQRVRFNFAKEALKGEKSSKGDVEPEAIELAQSLVLVDGSFDRSEGLRTFRISVIALKAYDPKKLVLDIFKIINTVLEGYRLNDFDAIEIQDYLNRQKLVVSRETLLQYQKKKISDAELLDQFLVESQSIQEAFKMFGFNVTQDSNDKEPVINQTTASH